MKKVLLSGVALLAMATSAQAEGLKLDVAGVFKGYAVYNNQDEAAGSSLDKTNIRKETEVHFTGETTLDSGLTVGVHIEADVDRDDDFGAEEAYMYLSGGWGRVNFGEEDGAGYLLQVAAPSVDANIDGLRQLISTYNATGNAAGEGVASRLDYDMVSPVSAYNNKLTYMTPVFNGFQAGVSYTPTATDDDNGVAGTGTDSDAGDYEDGIELAARYEGAFEGVGLALGAGYAKYDREAETAAQDDHKQWNVGVDLDFSGFGLGVAYLDSNQGLEGSNDQQTWVVGADYQMGAYKLAASYLNQETETNGADAEIDRWTVGASYSYGPGMSFRGSVSMIDNDNNIDSTQFSLGTQVNF